jgi:CRP/FNR family transcriptional regulator, cyclic AMP receptor protein
VISTSVIKTSMISTEQLAGAAPFNRLTAAQLSQVATTAREVSFPAGATVFTEGQVASGCWLISSGQIGLGTHVPGRGQVVVQTLGPGDLLGWSWLVPPHHWHFTATTSAPVSAVEFDTARLRALADADPALGYPLSLGLFEVLVARLQSTRSRLLDLYGSPRGR